LEEQQEAMLQYWTSHPELEAAGHSLGDLQYAADMVGDPCLLAAVSVLLTRHNLPHPVMARYTLCGIPVKVYHHY
jgi:hypothetical protein